MGLPTKIQVQVHMSNFLQIGRPTASSHRLEIYSIAAALYITDIAASLASLPKVSEVQCAHLQDGKEVGCLRRQRPHRRAGTGRGQHRPAAPGHRGRCVPACPRSSDCTGGLWPRRAGQSGASSPPGMSRLLLLSPPTGLCSARQQQTWAKCAHAIEAREQSYTY